MNLKQTRVQEDARETGHKRRIWLILVGKREILTREKIMSPASVSGCDYQRQWKELHLQPKANRLTDKTSISLDFANEVETYHTFFILGWLFLSVQGKLRKCNCLSYLAHKSSIMKVVAGGQRKIILRIQRESLFWQMNKDMQIDSPVPPWSTSSQIFVVK